MAVFELRGRRGHLWLATSFVLTPGILLCGCGGGDDAPYSSLPGPRPEGCERADAYDQDAITADLAYLASPELDGRAPGSEGDQAARDFIAERFNCLSLTSMGDSEDFQQPFTDQAGNETANVLAMIPGTDPEVGGESIVLSAHIDHFGGGLLGANDNASGLAALLAIAQDYANRGVKPDRTLVFAAFGSEETGFEGSEYFMSHPPAGIDVTSTVYNVNMDMVGSYTLSGTLYALGTFEHTPGTAVVADNGKDHPSLDISYGDESDLSDNYTFCSRGVPYIFFWTEDEECYHEECDTSSRVDYDALTEIASLIGAVTLELANSSVDLAGAVATGTDTCLLE